MAAEVLFTRFTSHADPLTKRLSLSDSGALVKTASADLYRGEFETLRLQTDSEGIGQRLADALTGWSHHQALSPSLCLTADAGNITTVAKKASQPASFARCKADFGFRADALGLLVADYDPAKGATPLTPDQLWQALRMIWPEVSQGVALHWTSAGSLIFNGSQELAGIKGQRFYIPIKSNADIPRALKVLNKRAWLQGGIGCHTHISSAGVMLPRSLFDSAMGEPARLDFAPAGAITVPPLEQRRQPPQVLADGEVLDTLKTLPDLTPAEEAEVLALIAAAKAKAEPQAQTIRAAWLAERQQSAAVEAVTQGADPDAARAQVKRQHDALLGGVLVGSAELIHKDEKGAEVVVTVDDLLRDPKRWHGKTFLSPHDPDHRNRSADAMAYLLQAVPTLHDLNDCISYRLQRQPMALQVTPGNRASLADAIAADLAATCPDLMNSAGELVRVVDEQFVPVSRPYLAFTIGTKTALHRTSKEGKAIAVDADQQTVEMVHALLVERVHKVVARTSIPLITPEGRIIAGQGLDAQTGIYLDVKDSAPIPASPSQAQTVAALKRLWKPWSMYGWTTPHDRAAMLATVLTSPLRPTIDAAPGLFVDAASQAAGKSSAIAAVMTIAQGSRANLSSWSCASEVELEKYLLSLAKSGAPVIAFDNVTSVFDSAVMATAIIEGRVSARNLGVTRAISPTCRAMWLASGNNAALGRDLATRYLQARIATPDGDPQRRSFAFEPSAAAGADRQGIARAIITVHRAWHAAGCPRADGIDTRFPAWGRTVRQMVLWLSASGLAADAGIGELGDPADSILNRVADSDPESESGAYLLESLREAFDGGGNIFTAREVHLKVRAGRDASTSQAQALHDAVMGFFPRGGVPSIQALSSVLKNRRDRTYAGLKLVMLPKTDTREAQRLGQLFSVVEV